MSAKPVPPSPSGLWIKNKPVTDWPTIRTWVLKRDGHLCRECTRNPATEVDHIWPRRLGGTDHIENLRALCGPCNRTKGARVDLAKATEDQLDSAWRVLQARSEQIDIETRDIVAEWVRRVLDEPLNSDWRHARSLAMQMRLDAAHRLSVAEAYETLIGYGWDRRVIAEAGAEVKP